MVIVSARFNNYLPSVFLQNQGALLHTYTFSQIRIQPITIGKVKAPTPFSAHKPRQLSPYEELQNKRAWAKYQHGLDGIPIERKYVFDALLQDKEEYNNSLDNSFVLTTMGYELLHQDPSGCLCVYHKPKKT